MHWGGNSTYHTTNVIFFKFNYISTILFSVFRPSLRMSRDLQITPICTQVIISQCTVRGGCVPNMRIILATTASGRHLKTNRKKIIKLYCPWTQVKYSVSPRMNLLASSQWRQTNHATLHIGRIIIILHFKKN